MRMRSSGTPEDVHRQLRIAGGDALAHGLRGRAPISMKPSGVTLTVTRSSKALPPVHSRKVAMPRPRSLPRAWLSPGARHSRPVGQLQALVEDGLEAAAVVHLPMAFL
jgi:hypothetical protein